MSAAAVETVRGCEERERILIVDDYDGMRVLFAIMVQRLGFEPVVVRSVEEALPEAEVPGTAAILCDLHMEGASGLELLARLRARGDRVPFVLMSAALDDESAATARRGGALAVDKSELVEALPRVLGRALSDRLRRSAGSPALLSRSRPSPSLVR